MSNTAKQAVILKNLTDDKTITNRMYNTPTNIKWSIPNGDKTIKYEVTIIGYDTNESIVKIVKKAFFARVKSNLTNEDIYQVQNTAPITIKKNIIIEFDHSSEQKSEKFTIKQINIENLVISDEIKSKIDDLPIYDISAYIGDKKTDFKDEQTLTIQIPVNTNKEDHKIIAVRIDSTDNIQVMKGVLKNGIMKFTAHRSSSYALIYMDKSFDDVTTHWGKEAIEALASRGVVNGVGDDAFNPEGKITRAEFAQMIWNMINMKK